MSNLKFEISDLKFEILGFPNEFCLAAISFCGFHILNFKSEISAFRQLEVPEGRRIVAHPDPVGVGKLAARCRKAPAGAAHPSRPREIKPLPALSYFLHSPALGGPCKESTELFAFAPNEPEELRGPQRVHVPAEKCFQAPANVGTGPRTQPVTFRRDPVIAERNEHQCREFIAFHATRRVERENSNNCAFELQWIENFVSFLSTSRLRPQQSPA